MTRLLVLIGALLTVALPLHAFTFKNIDGGLHDLDQWRGQPVLVVNTASQCAFTRQYDELQALQDRYGLNKLVVLTVPSDDFNQELATEDQVKEFCAINFNLTLPMTEITSVRGRDAHPFYAWVRKTSGFEPRWNFNKVLLNADGKVLATYGSNAKPLGRQITRQIDRAIKDAGS